MAASKPRRNLQISVFSSFEDENEAEHRRLAATEKHLPTIVTVINIFLLFE